MPTDISAEKYVSLTTFRANGQPVPTAVAGMTGFMGLPCVLLDPVKSADPPKSSGIAAVISSKTS